MSIPAPRRQRRRKSLLRSQPSAPHSGIRPAPVLLAGGGETPTPMSLLYTPQSNGAHSRLGSSACDTEPISVLVVDDSAFMRKMVSEMVTSDPSLRLAGTARDGQDALEQIETITPRVITLDIEMPQIDGFGVLRALANRPEDKPPISVVVLSSLTQQGADATLQCLNLGAVDFVGKPSGAISLDIHIVRDDLIAKIKAAGRAPSVGSLARRRTKAVPPKA